jgi:hypothetical protein
MKRFRRLYEINTRVWLRELVARHVLTRPDLAAVPEAYIDTWRRWGIDAVWLMGVWQPSPNSARVALADPRLQEAFQQALPDFTPDDCEGSPYAVRSYEVSELLGGLEGLLAFRDRLRHAGIGLILDFVPNHTACDHPWVRQHPSYYVQGSAADAAQAAGSYFEADTVTGRAYVAHGRDPYFPPWTDTAQLNYAHPDVHDAMRDELVHLAHWCDGVRCDMAMLCLPEVFRRTWPQFAASPMREFWAEAIRAVHRAFPDFCFIAEVYWGLEARLRQLGFAFTYDKEVYDALAAGDTARLPSLLRRGQTTLEAGLRFLENHDEAPAASRFDAERAAAAMLALLTLPGAVLLHDGQIEGRRHHTPVQLRRRSPEQPDPLLTQLYERLLGLPGMQPGTFDFLTPRAVQEGDLSSDHILAWTWQSDLRAWLVVINYASTNSRCWIDPIPVLVSAETLHFSDLWQHTDVFHSGAVLRRQGLYVELPAFGSHLFAIRPV